MQKTTLAEARRHFSRPERICWAVAACDGRRSICPLGWKMNTSGSPPMMAISVSPLRFTHDLIAESGQFVLAFPGDDLADATLLCGTRSGRDIEKFAAAHLTALPAEQVGAPLVAECIANLECRVAGRMTSGDHTIFVGEILGAWVNDRPRRLLCSVDAASGYDLVLEDKGYRFGVVRQ